MRIGHFEALRPLCVICRRDLREARPLSLRAVQKREGDVIVEGMLVCPNPACQREYPILDGIPFLLANLRGFFAENLFQLMIRDDLSPVMESVLGDCAGPGSVLDVARHHLSMYARDHYGLFDPAEEGVRPPPGATGRLLAAGMQQVGEFPEGPVVDVGCSVGGGTFALAEQTGRLVLGIDLHVPMLRLAQRALRQGIVEYPKRRTGVVYDRHNFPVHLPAASRVDFWACDVNALPFADDTFALSSALNVIDCTQTPVGFLAETARVLAPGAKALFSTPYDWSSQATPFEQWLGGHSQRSPSGGAGEPVLRALLTPGAHPASVGSLALESEVLAAPWHVRLHDRCTVVYSAHLVVARKLAAT